MAQTAELITSMKIKLLIYDRLRFGAMSYHLYFHLLVLIMSGLQCTRVNCKQKHKVQYWVLDIVQQDNYDDDYLQSLKVKTILRGEAPTSLVSSGALLKQEVCTKNIYIVFTISVSSLVNASIYLKYIIIITSQK